MNPITFITGVTTGAVVGAAITMLCDPVSDRQRRRLKKKTRCLIRGLDHSMTSMIKPMHKQHG